MNNISMSDFIGSLNRNNTVKSDSKITAPSVPAKTNTPVLINEFEEAKRKNGIIEKIYDSIKNLTNARGGSKQIENKLNQGFSESFSEEDGKKLIQNYRISQERASQSVGDIASVLSAGAVFFKLKNTATSVKGIFNLNAEGLGEAIGSAKITNNISKLLNGNKKLVVFGLLAGIAGGVTKLLALKLNRTGSKRYKLEADKTADKKEIKLKKKMLKSDRRGANFRNFATGAINGLMMPLFGLGSFIAAPVYVVANSLSRYFIGEKNDEKKKTFKSYINSLKNSPILNIAALAGIAVPLIKKGHYSDVLTKNADKVVEKLKGAKLEKIYESSGPYQELEKILTNDESISRILLDKDLRVSEKIQKLTEQNIFAIKFKQIQGAGDDITDALKENCPPSRTIEEAQQMISDVFAQKYKLSKCLGVGTVAESYLAKDTDGKEVCIKLLKKGISAEKIEKDKQSFISIIKGLSDKSGDEKTYLIKNLESLYEGISKEVDFSNEMQAAQKLAKYTSVANVVKPLEVKDGIYVMEKAKGISLDSLTRLNELFMRAKTNKLLGLPVDGIEEQIADVMKRTPEFKDINITKDDADYLLGEYMKVLVEQFSKTNADGKIIHGDIHPGNIFIDTDALKTRRGKIFTLIDTGNTINQSTEQALRAINLTRYIKNCDIDNITKFVLDGAKLPEGLSEKQAYKQIAEEFKKIFFDSKTNIGIMTNDELLNISNNIMKKLNIIPSDTQGALFKAKKSADNSLNDLREMFYTHIFGNLIDGKDDLSVSEIMQQGVKGAADMITSEMKYRTMKSAQENANLKKLPPHLKLKFKKSSGLPKNSEDYLTYKFKQFKGVGAFSDGAQ